MNLPAKIDINADLGEGGNYDEEIMPLISSVNIACGGHAGNEESIRKTIRLAKKHQVKVGAHPAYPDKKNFGRLPLDIDADSLRNSLTSQLALFSRICEEENVSIHHVKAHGALYNQGSDKKEEVESMLEVYQSLPSKTIVYCRPGSLLATKAKVEFPIWLEGFIDRNYKDSEHLLSRAEPEALIEDPHLAWEHFYRMFAKAQLEDYKGHLHPFQADTFCIHGDHENSLRILEYIHKKLNESGVLTK